MVHLSVLCSVYFLLMFNKDVFLFIVSQFYWILTYQMFVISLKRLGVQRLGLGLKTGRVVEQEISFFD